MLLIVLLLIAPFTIGYLLVRQVRPMELYVKGFLFMLSIYSGLYFIVLFMKGVFHTLCDAFLLVLIPLMVMGLFFCIRDRGKYKQYCDNFFSTIRKQWLYVCVMTVIVGCQIGRQIFLQNTQFRDDKTYVALVNDIVYSDILYGFNPKTGNPWDSISLVPVKWLLAPWYQFIAFLTKWSGLHTLVVYKTILPVVMIIMAYGVLWLLGEYLFAGNVRRQCIFVSICALLNEALAPLTDIATGMILWPSWGKNLSAAIAVPLLFLLLLRQEGGKCWNANVVWIFVVSIAGCAGSATAMMLIPIEVGILSIVIMVRTKSLHVIPAAIAGVIPPVLELGLYFLLTKGVLFL